MLKCYKCEKLLLDRYGNKPICLCISNSKELKEISKNDVKKCKKFTKLNTKKKLLYSFID